MTQALELKIMSSACALVTYSPEGFGMLETTLVQGAHVLRKLLYWEIWSEHEFPGKIPAACGFDPMRCDRFVVRTI